MQTGGGLSQGDRLGGEAVNAIVGSSADPAHLNVLRDWFRAEWGEEVVLDSGGATAPGPLVAIADGELLGWLRSRADSAGTVMVRAIGK